MKCDCDDYKENMEKINTYIVACSFRYGFKPSGYDGKIFVYCPWCGRLLQKEEEGDDKNN